MTVVDILNIYKSDSCNTSYNLSTHQASSFFALFNVMYLFIHLMPPLSACHIYSGRQNKGKQV